MEKIDNFDLKLLYELEQDARAPLTSLAKKLRSSQQVVSYRLSSLEKRGIIGEYYTILDIAKLGYTSYRTMIRLTNINETRQKEILSSLKSNPSVLWLVECGGRWDLIVNIMAENIQQYSEILRQIKNRFPENIQNIETLTTVKGVYFGRDYLINKQREIRPELSFGVNKYEELDKTDLNILNLLSENARINSTSIAEKIKISPNTVILRFKSLKERKIIQGFKPLIHLERIGYSGHKALIKFQNIDERKEREIINFLRINLFVVGIIKLVGSWDFEIEIEVKSSEDLLGFSRDFRDKFSSVINEFEIVPLFHEYKYNFFPKGILKEND